MVTCASRFLDSLSSYDVSFKKSRPCVFIHTLLTVVLLCKRVYNFSVDLPVPQGTSCVFLKKSLMKLHFIGLPNLNLRYIVFVLKDFGINSLDAMHMSLGSITFLSTNIYCN